MSTTPKSCAHVCTPNRQADCPSHTGAKESNSALLELLGLSTIKNVTSVDIALRPNDLPRITVQQVCRDLQPTTAHFHLLVEQVTQQPRLDLDAQCVEAQWRLQRFIERSVVLARMMMLERSARYDKMVRTC